MQLFCHKNQRCKDTEFLWYRPLGSEVGTSLAKRACCFLPFECRFLEEPSAKCQMPKFHCSRGSNRGSQFRVSRVTIMTGDHPHSCKLDSLFGFNRQVQHWGCVRVSTGRLQIPVPIFSFIILLISNGYSLESKWFLKPRFKLFIYGLGGFFFAS